MVRRVLSLVVDCGWVGEDVVPLVIRLVVGSGAAEASAFWFLWGAALDDVLARGLVVGREEAFVK